MPNALRPPLVVGVVYPAEWENRSRELLAADLAQLAAVHPSVEVIDVRYADSSALRTRRGADPAADLRREAPPLTAEQRAGFARVEVVIAQDLPFDIAQVAPRLRWVQGMGAGVSQLVSAGLAEAGIRLTTAAGVNAVSISEFVLARLLQMWKRLPEIDAHAARHQWEPSYGKEIAGLTVGVVGLGAIGRQVARRARALGLHVVGQRRSARDGDTDPDVNALFGPRGLPDVAAAADAVVAAVPETADTIGIFDAAFFAAMKPGSLFVNVGRGSAVVEEALSTALRSGHLAGAALDVTRQEPLPAESPLWDVPNLLISPHSATSVDRFWTNVHQLFRANLQRYINDEPLHNEVDAKVGG